MPAGHKPEASEAPRVDGPRYSIRVTSRLTSIELDTLRMWERRYGFPRPGRTDGGSRLYTEADVEALNLIRRALEHGYRPGEVVGKPPQELRALISVTAHAAPTGPALGAPTVASILSAVGRDDVATVRRELRQAAVMLGPKRFVMEVAHPVSVKVGELWAEGRLEVRHEHMLSECMSAQIRVLTSAYEERPGSSRVLLATLSGERHGLGLEMVDVYLAASQVTPILIGVDTPPEQIAKAALSHAVDAVGLLVTHASDLKATAKHVRWMLGELPRRVAIWIGGSAGPELKLDEEAIHIVPTWTHLDAAIATLHWSNDVKGRVRQKEVST